MKPKVKTMRVISGLEFQKVSWKSEYWIGFLGLIIGVIQLSSPDLLDLPWYKAIRVPVSMAFILLPFIIPLFMWLINLLSISIKRVDQYPFLLERFKQTERDLTERERVISLLIDPQNGIDLASATFRGEKYLITFLRSHLHNFQEDDIVLIKDRIDDKWMGSFRIIQIRNHDYIAESQDNIDSLWAGDIRQHGTVTVMPHFSAYIIPRGVQDGRKY